MPTTARLTSFVSPSSNVYETGGEAGAFYFSQNGTTGWISRPIPDASQDYVISTSGSDTAIALGSAGRLYSTSNNGRDWTEQSVPVVVPLNWALGESVIVGNDGVLLVYSGAAWQQRQTGVSANLYAVASGGTGNLVIVGEGGTILRSTNGAITVSTSGTTAALRDVATSGQNASFLVAVGDGGTALKTADSGATWCTLDTGTTVDLLGVAMAGNAEFIAVGRGGLVIRTTTGGGTCLPPWPPRMPGSLGVYAVGRSEPGERSRHGVVHPRAVRIGPPHRPRCARADHRCPHGHAARGRPAHGTVRHTPPRAGHLHRPARDGRWGATARVVVAR